MRNGQFIKVTHVDSNLGCFWTATYENTTGLVEYWPDGVAVLWFR
jgi:hypothetical protein